MLGVGDVACRDPRVPWYPKTFSAPLVAYALSPIDLIPDFIPVLGYLDELVLLPLGVLYCGRHSALTQPPRAPSVSPERHAAGGTPWT